MANSPTIVAATLDSQALESAINNLVAKVNKSTKQMADDFTTQINRMNEALKTLGTAESGSKTDGGASRRTASMEKLQKTVDDTTASLQKQESELSALKAQQQALADAEQNSAQAALQQEASVTRLKDKLADLKNETKYAKSTLDLLKSSSAEQLSPIAYTKNKAYDELAVANKLWDIMKRLKMDMNNGSLMTGNATEPIQKLAEYFKISREEAEKMVRTLRESSVVMAKYNMSFDTRFGLYELSMEKRSMLDKESPFYSQKTDWIIRQEKAIFEYEQALKRQEKAEQELTQATTQSSQASQQKAQVDSQVAAKEKEIAETRKQLTEATNNLENAQKQSDVSANASITRQKTQAENELTEATKKSTQAVKEKSLTLDQQDSAQKQAIQTTSKYSEQVRKLAAEIRATKEWQEKGHLIVGDVNYYDKERANVSKRDRQMLLSLEEQIVQAQQKEAQEALIAADAKRQQALAAKEAAQATRGVSSIEIGFSKDELNVSAGRLKQIESTKNLAQETQYLKQQVASLLEVEEQEIQVANTTSSSYTQLANYLKQLQAAYKELGADRIAKGEGADIANEIQKVQRAMQVFQKTMSRPVSLSEAMKEPENTLDDIAYKMQRLQAYKQGIDLTKPTAAAEMKEADEELVRLQKDADKWMGKQKSLIEGNNALGRSWNYMKNRLAFYFTVGASTQFVRNLIEVRSQYEMNERALGILIDSAERGTQIFNELSQMALVSPYTLIELSAAAKQLTAYDIAAKDVVDTTRRLADMASAVGIPIERLTYALGQIKAYGYLNNRDARMFANAGIPLVKQLSEYYTELEGRMVSTADVYDRMKKKAIDYSDVMSVINKMTDEGGKFFGFQEKMAETLKVQLANLTLAWNNMLNDIGKSQQGILTAGIGGLKQLFLHWKELNKVLNDAAIIFGLVYTAHMLLTVAYGKGSSQILLQAVRTRTLTTVQINQLLTTNNLTKAQLKFMLSLTKTNQEAVKQAATLGILNKKELDSVMSAGKIKTAWLGVGAAFSTVGKAIQALVASVAAAAPALLALTAVAAIVDLIQTVNDRNEAIKSLNESIVKNAEESAKSIKETLSSLNDIYENAGVKDATGLKVEEQEKAWEMLREQIELTSAASNKFIQTLLQEDKMGARVNKAKELLEHIQRVHEIMSTWHDDAIVVTDDFKILGIGADGLSEDLNDFQKYLNKAGGNIEELDEYSKGLGGTWRQILSYVYDFSDILSFTGAGTAHPIGWLKNIADATGLDFLSPDKAKLVDSYKEVMDEIEPLSKSIQKQILQDNITNLDEIKELVSKTINSIATERQWSDEKTLYARLLLEKQWGESQNAIFKNAVADNQTAWDAWMKYLTSRHKTEFSKMGAETISQEQWAQDGRKKLYEETFQKFKEHNSLAASMIEDSVHTLSQLQVHIKVFYDEQNTPSWIEQDFKKRVPTSNLNVKQYETVTDLIAGEQKALKDANEEMQRLRAAGVSELDKHFLDTKERAHQAAEALDAYNAEHEKVTKGGRGGSKKDILGEALSKEVQLITDIRKRYEEYKKIGVTAQEALKAATDEYGVSLKNVKNTLSKFGISGLEGVDVANMEMRDLVKKFEEMKTKASLKGNVKGVEALEKAIAALNVEITKLDYKKITDGLNNELGKLKDEYELAVELDANPELGDMFAQMFGIDTSTLPSGIWEYTQAIQDAVDHAIQEEASKYEKSLFEPFNILTDDLKTWADKNGIEVGSALYSGIEKAQNAAKDANKKYYSDIVKQTKDLEYKLADTNGKIAIEEEKLARLQEKLAKEVNDEKRRLLELQIQDQQNAILKLKEEVLQMLPTYVNLYSSIAEHSYMVTRRIAEQWKEALRNALKNPDGSYTVTDPKTGERATISEKQYGKEIDKVNQKLRSTQSTFKKIKEAFTEGEDGIIDWVKGLELLAAEAKKVAGSLKSVAEIVGSLGGDTATVNQINDLSSSLENLSDVAEGFVRIEDGDILGGIQTALSGISGLVSTLADRLSGNADINENIEKSERCVKRLELAYIDLEHAVSKTYGVEAIGVKKAIAYNKELQLVQLKRQLALEESRSEKNKDKDRIIELRKQIKELEYEIKDTIDEITNDMLGISSIGDAAESLVSSMIDAFKNGEDYMLKYTESFDKMIENMIIKTIAAKVIGQRIEEIWNQVQENARKRGSKEEQDYKKAYEYHENILQLLDGASDSHFYYFDPYAEEVNADKNREISEEEWKDLWNKRLEWLRKLYEKAVTPTPEDVKNVEDLSNSFYDDVKSEFDAWMDAFGIKYGEGTDKNLSALQQGIQSITEDTAGAIEAYLNGVSQQVYLQSNLLTEIRDAVVGLDFDIQVATQAQMLLQLQQSYQVQMSIQNILTGVLNPSGRAFSVELIS